MLIIIYNYRQQAHEVTIKDNEALRIPKTCKYILFWSRDNCTTAHQNSVCEVPLLKTFQITVVVKL